MKRPIEHFYTFSPGSRHYHLTLGGSYPYLRRLLHMQIHIAEDDSHCEHNANATCVFDPPKW